MWGCKDERILYLRKFGYNVISLPRGGIRPLTVACLQDGTRLTELGYLPEVWSSKKPAPTPEPAEEVAKIKGQSTDKLKAEVGVDILGNLVEALGADPVKVKTEYGKAKSLAFHFRDVERERITAFGLGEYLYEGGMSSNNPFVLRYFKPEEKVFVVTEVLKSNGFGVTATDASNAGLEVDVPALNQIVSVGGAINVESSAQGTVEFRGTNKLPFAFIAAQMTWENSRWKVVKFPDPGEIHLGESEPPAVGAGDFALPWKGAVLFGDEAVQFEERPATNS
jgi:hypothetical protein